MQKISTILTAVLLVAVAVLYYLHFSSGKSGGKSSSLTSNTHLKDSFSVGKQVIAYVDLDSINAHVNFIKEKKNELEAEQKVMSNELDQKYMALAAERNNFLKRGNAVPQQEAQDFQDNFFQKQQALENERQSKGQQLAMKESKVIEDMQVKLKDFLTEYNKDKKFTYILAIGTGYNYIFYKDSALNITDDIVRGLNEKIKPKGKP
ncbi:OmpH family outer membrane protein [Ferruginibacter sp. SUN002]|uniref:OmpH family outer membrane protein n=1 Tax=Ferruginibacter sp. SUN002 TaxID=2937789 RepID=UPI003D360818